MKKNQVIVLGCLMSAATVLLAQETPPPGATEAAPAEKSGFFDGGWRLSAGAVYDSGMKSRFHMTPYVSYHSPFVKGQTKTQAEAASRGEKKTDGSYVFKNKAWYNLEADPSYGGTSGLDDDFKRTAAYGFPESCLQRDNSIFFSNESYAEVMGGADAVSRDIKDDRGMPGFSIELARNLYHNEKHGYGVDAAFAFQYVYRNRAVRSHAGYRVGSSTYETGRYSTIGTEYENDEWSQGSYRGMGTYSDFAGGATIFGDPIVVSPAQYFQGESGSHSAYGGYSLEGDYENMEFMFLARPYYDIKEWLRVTGTLGLVISRLDFDLTMSYFSQDERGSWGRDYNQWDVYCVAGLGLQLYYKDFTLSGEFLARFFDRDLDIREDYIRGSVERGDWMFRLMLGYEF